MALAGITGGAASATGRGVGGMRRQRRAQSYTRENMKSAQDFAYQMDSTKYQRAMSDMKSAGLNPALMYQTGASVGGGTGASAPGGASQGDPAGPDIDVAKFASTANQMKKVKAEVKEAKARIKLLNEQATTESVKRDKLKSDTGHLGKFKQDVNIMADTFLEIMDIGNNSAKGKTLKKEYLEKIMLNSQMSEKEKNKLRNSLK